MQSFSQHLSLMSLSSIFVLSTMIAGALQQPYHIALAAPTKATLFGTNLIKNGNAEAALGAVGDAQVVPVPDFTTTPGFTTSRYVGGSTDLSPTTPGPVDRGANYFYGGPANALSSATQNINVSSAALTIDAANVTYTLSAWLGGYSSQDDNATLTATFDNATGTTLSTAVIGPVLSGDRASVSSLLSRQTQGSVPKGTRHIIITLQMTRTGGSDNDGMADDLSLILHAPSVVMPEPTVSTIIPANNTILTGSYLPFDWKAFPKATYYDLQMWLVQAIPVQDMTTSVITTLALRLTGSSYKLGVSTMPKGIYHWRMAATDGSGALISPWTAEHIVTIQ